MVVVTVLSILSAWSHPLPKFMNSLCLGLDRGSQMVITHRDARLYRHSYSSPRASDMVGAVISRAVRCCKRKQQREPGEKKCSHSQVKMGLNNVQAVQKRGIAKFR